LTRLISILLLLPLALSTAVAQIQFQGDLPSAPSAVSSQRDARLFSGVQGSSAPEAQEQQTTNKTDSQTMQQEREAQKKEESQRVLGVIPHFGVTSRQDAKPLRPSEKFHLFVKSAFDPATIGIVGIQAGLSQADNSFPDYGQGAQGYGKRFGAAFADEVSAGFFSNFAFPTLLKQDPRYFRLGKGSFKKRLFYGIKQELVCHTDSGGRSFHFSNVLGALSGGSLSNIYYPQSDRGFGLTMSRAGIALLYGTAGGLFDEFWPDINRKLFHRSNKKVNKAPTEAK
jgi:hypothetical protein